MYNGNFEVASLVYIYMYMYVQKRFSPVLISGQNVHFDFSMLKVTSVPGKGTHNHMSYNVHLQHFSELAIRGRMIIKIVFGIA